MTEVERMAAWVVNARGETMSGDARTQLKLRLLDGLGCGIGALDGEPIAMLRSHLADFGGAALCGLIGGGATAPDRAALYNGALIRYLDYNDSYLAKKETCHPSDNIAPVLVAAEYANASGETFLTALAVAYQVHCRLSDVAPVRAKGFDHTTQGSYAVAAGCARALGLDAAKTANAIAIAGTAFNALRVTRTGALSHWKGLAYPNTAFCGTHAAFLALRGITGPAEVFEGNKGFKDAIAGHFDIDWAAEDLERVRTTIIKKYNAEIHSQCSIEGALELKKQHGFAAADIDRIKIDTFDVAFHIIGGGEEGDKTTIRTKEEADHSLHYMVAVALLDDGVYPPQYAPERIVREDVQSLLRRVSVRENPEYSARFPNEMVTKVKIHLRNGKTVEREQNSYEGFHSHPMSQATVEAKFTRLAEPHAGAGLRKDIVAAVLDIERLQVRNLTALLGKVGLVPSKVEGKETK